MKVMKKKQRHQVKSRWYYIFWGTATVAVCAGQIFVGSGFRRMAESLENILEAPIIIDMGIPRPRGHIMPSPDMWEEPPIKYLDDDIIMWRSTGSPQRIH
tara:strand:+ start:357 stop:656 length:300 start_codon:yes stop_codon:yes gene_type:complete